MHIYCFGLTLFLADVSLQESLIRKCFVWHCLMNLSCESMCLSSMLQHNWTFWGKKHHENISKCLFLPNKKDEDTALIEFVSYLMKTECPHEWKPVSSVLHWLGWLLTHWLALNGRRLAGETEAHENCRLELSLRCGSGDCKLGSLYTQKSPGLLSLSPAVQECKRHQERGTLAEGGPRAEGNPTHVALLYLSSTTFPVR